MRHSIRVFVSQKFIRLCVVRKWVGSNVTYMELAISASCNTDFRYRLQYNFPTVLPLLFHYCDWDDCIKQLQRESDSEYTLWYTILEIFGLWKHDLLNISYIIYDNFVFEYVAMILYVYFVWTWLCWFVRAIVVVKAHYINVILCIEHVLSPYNIQNTVTRDYFFKYLRGYCTPRPYFWRLCAFSQKIKQLRTKYPMDLVRNVPRNSKITVLLQSRDHCCEVTVKNVWKSIFSMFWAINQ